VDTQLETWQSHPIMDTLLPKTVKVNAGRLVKFGTHTDYSFDERNIQQKPQAIPDISLLNEKLDDTRLCIEAMRRRIMRLNVINRRVKAGLMKIDFDLPAKLKELERALNRHISMRRRIAAKISKIVRS